MSTARRVAALAGATLTVMSVGCSTTVTGSGRPEAPSATSTTTTPPAKPKVTAADLPHMLLTVSAVAALTGAPTIAYASPDDWARIGGSEGFIDDPACGSVATAGDASIYTNSGFVGIRGNRLITPPDAPPQQAADVVQAAAYFPDQTDATAFLQRTHEAWDKCSNRHFAVNFVNGIHGHLDVGEVSDGADRAAIALQQQEDPTWKCSHVLAVRNTVEVDARVCARGKDPAAAATDMVNQMLAAVPS